MTPTKEEIKAGDYVIDENYKLHIVKSVEEREKGNLRYNFENGRFRLKDETHLGNPNGKITKVDVSDCALQQVAPQWISVEERLPESNCNVLCLKKNGGVLQMSFHAPFDSGKRVFQWWGFGKWVDQHNETTHWMPLPKPPTIEHLTEKLDNEK